MKIARKIFITSFHVLVSRNILATPVLDLLRRDGFEIVVIVPKAKAEYFRTHFGHKIIVEGIENKLNRLDNLFKDLALAAIRTRALLAMRRRNMGIERPIFQKLFFFAPLVRSVIPMLYRVIMPKHAFRELFEKHKPSLLFSTDVFSANDCRLMLEARTNHIPVFGMVRSWDNLTTKGGFRVIPDTLITQNVIAEREAINLHGIDKTIIKPVGIPHYDNYLNGANDLPDVGVPKGARFVVYAPLGDRIMKVGNRMHKHKFDDGMVKILDKILPKEIFLLVRLPPTDTATIDKNALSSRVLFQEPGVRFGSGVKGVRLSEMSPEDDILLLATIKQAQVVINPFSSLCVDAAFLNRPIVVPAFDPEPVPYAESINRIQEFEHFQEVMKSGGVKVALNESELSLALNAYLADDTLDASLRKLFAKSQTFNLDGKASERLASILSALKEVS